EDIADLSENKDLMKVLNNSRVNILPVETRPSVGKWMQNSFQFSTLNSKPAIYQLEHDAEKNLPLNMRLACTLSRQCKIPYFKPQGTKAIFEDGMDLNSGGNLEFIPGGSAIMGIIE